MGCVSVGMCVSVQFQQNFTSKQAAACERAHDYCLFAVTVTNGLFYGFA